MLVRAYVWLFLILSKLLGVDSFYREKKYFQTDSFSRKSLEKASESVPVNTIAILFDCDGVIVETEELHRIAYNKAFEFYQVKIGGKKGELVHWDQSYYNILQNTVGGGKPKMRYHFNEVTKKWPGQYFSSTPKLPPRSEKTKEELLDLLQNKKMEFFDQAVSDIASPRPGVLRLFDEIISNNSFIKVGICSASTRQSFEKIISIVLGKERIEKLQVIMAGDDVSERKPHPMIYQIAAKQIAVPPERCLIIEDSLIGLKAAKAAGMKCVITYTEGTKAEDFRGYGAEAVYPDLSQVSLSDLIQFVSSSPAKSEKRVVSEYSSSTSETLNEKVQQISTDISVFSSDWSLNRIFDYEKFQQLKKNGFTQSIDFTK